MSITWIEPKDAKRKKGAGAFLIPFIVFFTIPILLDAAILASVSLSSSLTMVVIKTSFFVPIVLFVVMAFYYPGRRYELTFYFLVIYLANSFLIVYLNTIKTEIIGFAGNGLFIYFFPWLVFSILGILYFPVKLGFDLNIEESPLESSEEGYFSNNRTIRAFQIYGDLPLTKPRGVLISIYGFLTVCSVLAVVFLNWQEKS